MRELREKKCYNIRSLLFFRVIYGFWEKKFEEFYLIYCLVNFIFYLGLYIGK